MAKQRNKIVLNRLYMAYGAGALAIYLLIMIFVLPWWNVSNHPVMINLGAGAAQNVELAFSDEEAALPLVPVGQTEGYQWSWGTELPPRPSYQLALVFPDGTNGEVILKDVKVVRLAPTRETFPLIKSNLTEPEDGSVRIQNTKAGYRIQADAGARLILPIELPSVSTFDWLRIWLKATIGYAIVALILLFTLATFLLFPDGIRAYRKRTPAFEVIILLVVALFGAVAHFHLVRHSMPGLSNVESEAILLQAIGVDKDGSALGSQGLHPGYPRLVGKVAELTDWDLSNLIKVQAVLFCASVILLALSMVRMVQGYLLAPVVLLALLSPAALWASCHVGIESTLSSAWISAIAAFLFLWQCDRWKRWLGFAAFSICAAWATTISPTGLMLYTLPLGLLIGTIWWTASIRGFEFWKMSVFWNAAGQVFVPVLVLLVTSFMFSGQEAGDPQICEIPSPKVAAPFSSGMFEVGALLGTESYSSVINERAANGYRFDGPLMKEDPTLAENSYGALPLRARLVAWGRLTGWGLFLPKIETYSGEPLNQDYKLRTKFRSASEAEQVRQAITEVMRQTGVAVFVPEKRSNRQLFVYNQSFIPIYSWFYRILFFGALAGWMIGLAERKYLAAVLVLPFLLKVLLHIIGLDVSSGYIQSLDVCLWMGALAGLLSVNPKAMQKPTDEGDRRCMPPIRPKRLLNLNPEVTGTPF